MTDLRVLIANHQDWLVNRLKEIAKDYPLAIADDAWRRAISGLSAQLLAEAEMGFGIADTWQSDEFGDPISAHGMGEALRHRSRGVSLTWFMRGLKWSRQVFSDFVRQKAAGDARQLDYLILVNRFFDRIELGVISKLTDIDKELISARDKYYTICESLSNPVFLLDEQHLLQWINAAAANLLSDAGLFCSTIGSNYEQLQAPDWLVSPALDFAASGVDKRTYPVDLEISAELRHFKLKASRVVGAGGTVLPGAIFILSDVTDYIKALEGDSRYRILARRMTDVILILNNDGQIIEANDAALKVFDVSGRDIRSFTIYDLIEPARYDRVSSRFAQMEIEPILFETEMCRTDGTCFPVEISAEAAHLGEETVYACIIRDISEQNQVKAKIQAAYAELDQLFSAVADGMVAISADFTVTRVNKRFAEMIGQRPGELVGCKCYEIMKTPICHTPKCTLTQIANGLSNLERELEVCNENDERRCLLVTSAPVKNADGSFCGLVESLKDITERKKVEEELKNYRLLLQQAQDIILFVRLDGRIIEVNEAALNTYGYTREEFQTLGVKDLRLPGTEEVFRAQMLQAYQSGIVFETIHRRRDGSTFPVEVSSRRVTVGGEVAILSIVRDITERKQAEEEIRYLSFHDKLTGLYNRAYFEEQLIRAYPKTLPCSIIMGDLNGLKLANDAFSHATGDRLLKEMADILSHCSRADDVVARIGGDEFAIILPGADELAALSVAERIRNTCKKSRFEPLAPSIALGVATRVSLTEDIFEVFQTAETRMYRRKLLEADSSRSTSIKSLQRSLRERSCETDEHTIRLKDLAHQLAEAMNLPPEMVDDLNLLASLHDIGKIGIPDDILNKPSSLTAEEWEVMKCHSEIGYRIARTSPQLAPIADYILAHHERWDGSGYPRGLAGESIPLAARVLAVVDAFDAMTSDRPYKSAISIPKAIDELRRCAGTQFDPAVVSAFISMVEDDYACIGA